MKHIVLPLLFLVFACGLGALEIHIAPFYFIDEVKDSGQSFNNYHNRLASTLNLYENGVDLRFNVVGRLAGRAPQSTADALSVAKSAHAEYLLYGFVVQKEFSIQIEVRLLDYGRNAVAGTFYAMDEKGMDERMLAELANKIRIFIDETYGIPLIEDKEEYMHVSLPFYLGYWSPLGGWFPLLYGTASAGGGIKLIPTDNLFVMRGYVCYISTGLLVNYRLGLGNKYRAYDHGLSFMVPVTLHTKLNVENEMFFGIGLGYALDFLNIKQHYHDFEVKRSAAPGMLISGGYLYRFSEKLSFVLDNKIEVRWYKKPMVSYSFTVGLDCRIYTRKVEKKW
jgi:hypothetical protein